MTDNTDWGWYAARGADPENYNIGPENTREAIVQVGLEELDGEPFSIIEARKGPPPPPSAATVMDAHHEALCDDGAWGDDDGERRGVTDADQKRAEAALQAALNGWWDTHWNTLFMAPWVFAHTRNEELIIPPGWAEDAAESTTA